MSKNVFGKTQARLRLLRAEKGPERLLRKKIFQLQRKSYTEKESRGSGSGVSLAHVTYCTAGNAGDTVLSQCVRRTFEAHMPVGSWDILPVKGEVTGGTIEEINRCGMLVIGGGGLFLPDTNPNAVSGWQWAVSSAQLRQLQVPVCVFSVGYNYFRGQQPGELFRESLCELAAKSSFFGLRNTGSVLAVRGLLPDDLAEKVVWQPCTTTLIRRLYADSLPPKKETGCVAVNMAFDREDRRYGADRETILTETAKAIRAIQDRGYRIYYVCHSWTDDRFLPFLESHGVEYKLVDLSFQYPDAAYLFYNKMDVVLGMRGHAQMIPFGVNTEIISLGTHNKVKWFLEDLQAEDWYVDITDKPNEIADRILGCFCTVHEMNREQTRKRLLAAQNMLWEVTNNNLTEIMSIPVMK